MKKSEAEKITTQYLKPIYSFALKRCKSLQDAEDLSQEIAVKVFRTLLVRDDIEDVSRFIWTIAHNALSNYYRDSSRNFIGASIDEIADTLCDDTDISSDLVMRETAGKLQGEIAYLSKLQRRIVIAYYYENRKQSEIAEELKISVGTVKWHLFEAKKDLKRGIQLMRTSGELKFNPVRFAYCGTNGSVGTKGSNSNFFRSALSQNIEYSVWKKAKTVNEIADDLGVSPVYVESEAEYLEEYGFLKKRGNRYLCNILLDEPTTQLNRLHDEMYEKAAKIFANELYDELMNSDILDNPCITGGFDNVSFTGDSKRDKSFFMWALIPYIASYSGEAFLDTSVSFDEAATIRADGGHNICYASVMNNNVTPPKYFESMKHWCGPCRNECGGVVLWLIDCEWSQKQVDEASRSKDISLLVRYMNDEILTEEEYAYLTERGYIKSIGSPDGLFKSALKCVCITGKETKSKLIAIGDKIKEKHINELNALQKPYADAVLKETPEHLLTMQKYGLQFTFYGDGRFIIYCLKELVNNGKLKEPENELKKALTTLIIKE
ncbi:MAG: RNA polymerase sigma factor [Eubacterium sp.]